MPEKVKIKLDKKKATVEEGRDTFIGKLLLGSKKKIRIKHPLFRREVKVKTS